MIAPAFCWAVNPSGGGVTGWLGSQACGTKPYDGERAPHRQRGVGIRSGCCFISVTDIACGHQQVRSRTTAHAGKVIAMSRTYTLYLAALVGAVCAFFIVRAFFLGHFFVHPRTVRLDVLQGFLIGAGLAFVTAQAFARIKATKVNGWITMFGLGVPGNGMLLRAAHAQYFPGPVNVPEEAMYWWVNADGAGDTLSGVHDYMMHFPPGGLPPNDAFWSLTMGDAKNRFVANPINRYSVSDRSGLVPNADGSVDIYIQNTAPTGYESNWLPAPGGKFILWLRVYVPGAAILDGKYKVPPIVEVKR
jgi:hypothetical protein